MKEKSILKDRAENIKKMVDAAKKAGRPKKK